MMADAIRRALRSARNAAAVELKVIAANSDVDAAALEQALIELPVRGPCAAAVVQATTAKRSEPFALINRRARLTGPREPQQAVQPELPVRGLPRSRSGPAPGRSAPSCVPSADSVRHGHADREPPTRSAAPTRTGRVGVATARHRLLEARRRLQPRPGAGRCGTGSCPARHRYQPRAVYVCLGRARSGGAAGGRG